MIHQNRITVPALALALAAPTLLAQPGDTSTKTPHASLWAEAESWTLTDHVQLTFPQDFTKAGEQYFDPTMTWIIFQAVPRPEDPAAKPDEHYSMYVAKLIKSDDGHFTGIEKPIRVSPPGSANTCGYFHPITPHRIIFGSTLTPPSNQAPAGYQRNKSDYAWQFPAEMEVVSRLVPEIARARGLKVLIPPEAAQPRPLFERPGGYDAECAYSPDARHIVFSSHDPEKNDVDIFVYDSHTDTTTRIVEARGYDGGPFFSPDGKRICYRSDRVGNDLLQIFVADLAFDDTGAITGIEREYQLTHDHHVNWAPYWHPSGSFLVFTSSRKGHRNYEVFSISVPDRGLAAGDYADRVLSKQITHAPGFDGLPVFSPDAQTLIWTSQRGEKLDSESRPSSQLWIARVKDAGPE